MSIPKKYLTETIILVEARIDNLSILRILTQNKQIDKADTNYNYYVQLANWANSQQEKTGKIDLNTIKLSDRSLIQKGKLANNTKHLGATLERLKNLMDQEGKYDSNSELSNLIQQTTLEILAGLSGIKNPKPENEDEDDNDSEDEKYPEGKIDWTAYKAKQLAEASKNNKSISEVLEEFYEFYYRKEYAGLKSKKEPDTDGIVAKLKSLDKILIPEFNKLGYNPEVNPFASFLKILIERKTKNSTIFDSLNTNNYGAIHNSFIDRKITGNMLGRWDADSESNILFCEDLYSYKGLDIVKYLSIQKSLLDRAKSDDRFSAEPSLLAVKLLIHQNETGDTYADKVNALLNISKPIKPIDKGAKLRSALEISELYTYLFKDKLSNNEKTDQEKEREKVIKLVIDQAEFDGILADMIYYIIRQDSFKNDNAKDVERLENALKSYQPSQSGINDSAALLQKIKSKGITLSNKDLLMLVNGLYKKYKKEKDLK